MSNTDNWLDRFAGTQQELRNPYVYWLALPMLIVGLVGLLWYLPIPVEFAEISPLLNWGSAFLMATAVYYFIISLSLAIGSLPLLVGLAIFQVWLGYTALPQPGLAIALLISGICGLLLGRAGNIGLVLQDIQLAMLSPLWLLSILYRRLGIPV